jgi:hypothetical protein
VNSLRFVRHDRVPLCTKLLTRFAAPPRTPCWIQLWKWLRSLYCRWGPWWLLPLQHLKSVHNNSSPTWIIKRQKSLLPVRHLQWLHPKIERSMNQSASLALFTWNYVLFRITLLNGHHFQLWKGRAPPKRKLHQQTALRSCAYIQHIVLCLIHFTFGCHAYFGFNQWGECSSSSASPTYCWVHTHLLWV